MTTNEIETFFTTHKRFFETKDIQGIMSNHMDASLFWEQTAGTLIGRNEIRGWFNMMFGLWDIHSADYEIVMVRADEQYSSCALLWNLTGALKETPDQEQTFSMRVSYCLQKSEEGWKIWHAHSSQG